MLSLSDRMKLYEKTNDYTLNPNMYYMIRLDGKNFSKMVKRWKLNKPFDEKFNIAMCDASKSIFDLLPNVECIWTGSDEISIFFIDKNPEFPFFEGRIQKIISLVASKVSIMFNMSLLKQNIININSDNLAIFDARIMQFPNINEVINYFLFRQRDCIRNSISGYAQTYFSNKELSSINSEEKIKKLKEIGLFWDEFPFWSKYGVFFKRVTYEIINNNELYIRHNFNKFDKIIENDFESFNKFLTEEIKENITQKEWVQIKEVK